MAGGVIRWPIGPAWSAAAQVSANAYGVQAPEITAPSRGRGPRPPQSVWAAKKMAVHLTVILTGADYACVGRHIGLHRDTVASHCAAMRQEASESDVIEVSAQALEQIARGLLERQVHGQIEAVRAHLAMLEASVGELHGAGYEPAGSFVIRHTSDASSDSQTGAHGNVMNAHATAKVGLQ